MSGDKPNILSGKYISFYLTGEDDQPSDQKLADAESFEDDYNAVHVVTAETLVPDLTVSSEPALAVSDLDDASMLPNELPAKRSTVAVMVEEENGHEAVPLEMGPKCCTSPTPFSRMGNNLSGSSKASGQSLRESRKLKRFYKKQNELQSEILLDQKILEKFEKEELNRSQSQLPSFENGCSPVAEDILGCGEIVEDPGVAGGSSPDLDDKARLTRRRDNILARLSLLVNCVLLVIKIVAAVLSGSLSVVSSVVDSAVDITSGLVIWISCRQIEKRDPYHYPRGRTRLEPLAIIIVSIIMGIASIEMIVKTIENMVTGSLDPDVGLVTIAIMVATILMKLVLMIVCYKFRSVNTLILAQDHRNDCISNTVAIVCAYIGSKVWVFADPIGAILVSLYIAATWVMTGKEHVKKLTGFAAKPAEINRIIKIVLDHDPRILQIDTVHAYHFGTNYLVEVDIVLPEEMPVREAHDVAESLQRKIERLSFCERCFVHIDYESDHRPDYEHKPV